MSIEVRSGDVLKSKCHALVNTVNCVGVMGKGIALSFKRKYPAMNEDYVARCNRGEVRLGEPYPYFADDGHVIVNFPTKNHWRAVSRLSDIVDGLAYLRSHYKEWGIRSIAVPPLGCGNGQLEWHVVGPTLHRGLADLDIPVELYAPIGTPVEEMQLSFFTSDNKAPEAQFIEPAWIAIVEVLSRIQRQRHHWPVGHVRFQKIAYFLTSLDVPTGLEYGRGPYGPYAAGLKRVISRLVNNGLIHERRLGQMIEMQVGATYADARETFAADLDKWQDAIDRVTDLLERTRTDQAEVAATVHLVSTELTHRFERRPTDREVAEEVDRWKPGRMKPSQIDPAITNLAMHGWIRIDPSPDVRDLDEQPASRRVQSR